MKTIKEIRNGLAITETEMAAHCNITVEAYRMLENGEQQPAAATLTKLKLLEKCMLRKPVPGISIVEKEMYQDKHIRFTYNKWVLETRLKKAQLQYDMSNHEHTSLLLLTMTDYMHVTRDAFQSRIVNLEYTLHRASATINTLKIKIGLLTSQIDTISGYLGKTAGSCESPTFTHN